MYKTCSNGLHAVCGQNTVLSVLSQIKPTTSMELNSNFKHIPLTSEEEESNHRKLPSTAYFSDGYKIIDFVLAFQPLAGRKKRLERARFRQKFEAAMKAENLMLEYDGKERSHDGKTAFVKVHATWEALTRQAELEELQMPLAKSDLPGKPTSLRRRALGKIFGHNPFELQEKYKIPRQYYFTDAYARDREEQFLIEDYTTFFNPAQRAFLTWSIISGITISLEFTKKKKRKVDSSSDLYGMGSLPIPEVTAQGRIKTANIQYLLREKMYCAAYPLHDCDMREKGDIDLYTFVPVERWPMRKYLYESWARPAQWYKHQPLDEIRSYYGEKVGLYFAWLGFYTKMLILPSIVGTIIFLCGLIYGPLSEYARSFCSTDGRLGEIAQTLLCRDCPNSELCPYVRVSSFCMYAVINAIFDNIGTTIFAIFMAVWAILFLEFWKRYQSELCSRWDVDQMQTVVPQVRPDYTLSVTTTRLNPITKKYEPYLPASTAAKRLAASISSVCFFVAIVVALMASVMVYKVLGPFVWLNVYKLWDDKVENATNVTSWEDELSEDLEALFNPALMTTITASLLNGVFIAVMTKIYMKAAWKLTTLELPRTEHEFEQSYIYKVSIFQFVNFYGSLFYLAFIRGQFVFAPSSANKFNPKCPLSGCLVDVMIQLAVIMIGKQTMNNAMELGLPLLKNYIKKKQNKGMGEDAEGVSRWERDFYLEPVPPINLFSDYLEMLIQFGFITMFVPAFPLAPVCALINNIIEIRLDAYKMLTQTRRCIPYRSSNIEPWFGLMSTIGKLAVVTNAFLIALTTNFVDQLTLAMFKHWDYSIAPENKTLVEFMLSHVDPHIFCEDKTNEECQKLIHHNKPFPVQQCYYRDYRKSTGNLDHTRVWFTVMATKFAFVIIFEHIVLLVQAFVGFVIPDVPEHVTLRTQRENFLQRQAFKEHEYQGAEHEHLMVENIDESEEEWDMSSLATSYQAASNLHRARWKEQQQKKQKHQQKPFYVVLFKKLSLC